MATWSGMNVSALLVIGSILWSAVRLSFRDGFRVERVLLLPSRKVSIWQYDDFRMTVGKAVDSSPLTVDARPCQVFSNQYGFPGIRS